MNDYRRWTRCNSSLVVFPTLAETHKNIEFQEIIHRICDNLLTLIVDEIYAAITMYTYIPIYRVCMVNGVHYCQ